MQSACHRVSTKFLILPASRYGAVKSRQEVIPHLMCRPGILMRAAIATHRGPAERSVRNRSGRCFIVALGTMLRRQRDPWADRGNAFVGLFYEGGERSGARGRRVERPWQVMESAH